MKQENLNLKRKCSLSDFELEKKLRNMLVEKKEKHDLQIKQIIFEKEIKKRRILKRDLYYLSKYVTQEIMINKL